MVGNNAMPQQARDNVVAFLKGREKFVVKVTIFFHKDSARMPVEKEYTLFAQNTNQAYQIARNLVLSEYPTAWDVALTTSLTAEQAQALIKPERRVRL